MHFLASKWSYALISEKLDLVTDMLFSLLTLSMKIIVAASGIPEVRQL